MKNPKLNPKHQMKALVVDDNPMDRMIIVGHLRKMGFGEIMESENGSSAHFKLENYLQLNSLFDLVVIDWQMNQMNGLKLLKLIRSNPKFNKTKIIMITGQADHERVKESALGGADNFLVKPVDPNVFEQKVDETLAKH